MIRIPKYDDEIRLEIESINNDAALYEDVNFNSRVQAIDYIEFNILDRVEGLLQSGNQSLDLTIMKQSAEMAKRHLEEIDDNLFLRLRADIRSGVCTGQTLKDRIDRDVGLNQ